MSGDRRKTRSQKPATADLDAEHQSDQATGGAHGEASGSLIRQPASSGYPNFWKSLVDIKRSLRKSQIYLASNQLRPPFSIPMPSLVGVRSVAKAEPEAWRAHCMIVRRRTCLLMWTDRIF